MVKKISALILSLGLFAGSAFADEIMNLVLANSLVVSGANGEMTVNFAADGTYTSDSGVTGTWEMKGEDLCVTRSTGESNCSPLKRGVTVGDSWEGTDAAGNPVTLTIK